MDEVPLYLAHKCSFTGEYRSYEKTVSLGPCSRLTPRALRLLENVLSCIYALLQKVLSLLQGPRGRCFLIS